MIELKIITVYLCNIFQRQGLLDQDVRILRGVITALSTARLKKEGG